MNGLITIRRFPLCLAAVVIAAGALPWNANAQGGDAYSQYLTRIAELDRIGSDVAREQGKAALVDQYRALIDAYPGFGNNLQLETQIGYIYEWDLRDSGQPPDLKSAYEQYVSTTNRYDATHPYMKTVRELAASRAVTVDPNAAQDLYTGLLEDYPEDGGLAVESLFSLGHLAQQRGDDAGARKFYEQAVNYEQAQETTHQAELDTMEAYRANAALALLAAAIQQSDDPAQRIKALEDFLAAHPGFSDRHADLVERVRDSLQHQMTSNAPAGLGGALKNLASTLTGPTRDAGVRAGAHPPGMSPPTPHSSSSSAPPGRPGDQATTGGAPSSRAAVDTRTPSNAATRLLVETNPVVRGIVLAVIVSGALTVILFIRRRIH
jgi:tetratricopeptide (TPR) repeat protein